jgi:hypothetical protein
MDAGEAEDDIAWMRAQKEHMVLHVHVPSLELIWKLLIPTALSERSHLTSSFPSTWSCAGGRERGEGGETKGAIKAGLEVGAAGNERRPGNGSNCRDARAKDK